MPHPDGDLYWASIAQQKLGSFWYYNKDFKTTRFDAPEMKESLQFFYDMYMVDQSCIPLAEYKALRLQDDITAMNGLYSGRYAMWIAPVYGCLYLNKSYGEIPAGTDIGMTNFPRPVGSAAPSPSPTLPKPVSPPTSRIPRLPGQPSSTFASTNAELFAGPKAMHPGYQFKNKAEADAFNKIIFSNHPGLDFDMAMKVMGPSSDPGEQRQHPYPRTGQDQRSDQGEHVPRLQRGNEPGTPRSKTLRPRVINLSPLI